VVVVVGDAREGVELGLEEGRRDCARRRYWRMVGVWFLVLSLGSEEGFSKAEIGVGG